MCVFKRIEVFGFTIIFTLSLCACSANHYSIHKEYELKNDSSTAIAIDAKQRFLISSITTKTTESTSGAQSRSTEIYRRYCTEPSPDVFSVLSQAASGSGSFGQAADPKSINVALQAAFTSSETGSTISRTQTVNMLKEMMYRTCERYLNGQISELEYPVIAARDQRIMTSILAIEQLTGTLQQRPVIIAATGNASTGHSTTDAISSLENAKKDVNDKKSALATAKKELSDIDNPVGTCKALLDKKADEVKTDDDKSKLKECSDKNSNITNAEAELKTSKTHYDTITNLAAKTGSSSATAGAQTLYQSSLTDIDKQIEQLRLQNIQSVADVVNKIVARSFDQNDETSFFCYRAIDKNINSEVSKSCVQYILAKVENEAARLKLETEQAMATDINKAVDKIRELTPDQALSAERNLAAPIGYVLTKMKDKGIEEKRLVDGNAAKKALETRVVYSSSHIELKSIVSAVNDAVQDWAIEINKLINKIRMLSPEQALTAEKSLAAPTGYALNKIKEEKIEKRRLTDGVAAKKALEIRAIYIESNNDFKNITKAINTLMK